MQYRILIVFMIFWILTLSITAQENRAKLYGKEVKLKRVDSFSEVCKNPGKFKGRNILIEGIVVSVCQKKGSWMEIKNGKEKIRVRFESDGFLVPFDSQGKKVRVQGKVNREIIKEAIYKQWLKDSGEPQELIEKIKGNQKVVMLTASGVLMEGGSEISQNQLDIIKSIRKK